MLKINWKDLSESIKLILDWFINTAREKQIVIILAIIIAILFVDRTRSENKFEIKIDRLEKRQLATDSLYIIRFNDAVSLFQQKIEECNEARVKELVEQSSKYQEKYDKMAKRTDELYQQVQRLKNL